MNKMDVRRAKRIFRKFDKYPSTTNLEEHKVALGAIGGREYWTAYNEHYGTNYPTNVDTIRKHNVKQTGRTRT